MSGQWVLVAEKSLQASDLNTNQNRLLLRRSDAQRRLLPLLRQSELESVRGNGGFKIEISTGDSDRVFEVRLKNWESSKGFIFNGRGWRDLRSHFKGRLAEGNILRFYSFRGAEEEGEERRKLRMRMVVVPCGEMMKAADVLVSFRHKLMKTISTDD